MASGRSDHDRYVIEGAPDQGSPFASLVTGARRARDVSMSAGEPSFPLSALPIQPAAPPHPWLDMLSRMSIPGVILPLGRSTAHDVDWVVCPRPLHPSVGRDGALDEQTLMNKVLRPAAGALARMQAERLTHRAICPGNLFVSEAGVELGPFWLTPPAFLQPAIYETPASASCVKQGRGVGTIADDVYALGVTILALHLGETPMAGIPDAEIIERKLWQGSYAALTEGRRIPFGLAEIIAAMVADQPSQRPPPERLCRTSVLTGPATSSRKRVNAAIPMVLAGREVWNAPQLAFLIGEEPEVVANALELGQVDAWLRRGLNEVVLAERLETAVHPGGLRASPGKMRKLDSNARAALLSRVARMLDPEAPVVWDRLRLMPDGLPGLLAGCGSDSRLSRASVVALLSSEALMSRAMDEPQGPAREIAIASAHRAMVSTRSEAAMLKLTYELNPSMSCASPILTRRPVSALANLLPALEGLSEGSEGDKVLDQHLVAFIGVRRLAAGLKPVRSNDALAELRLLAALSTEFECAGLPNLTRRLAIPLIVELEHWPGASRRQARRDEIGTAVAEGDPLRLLSLAEDHDGLARDSAAQLAAHQRIRMLEDLRNRLGAVGAEHEAAALRFGREGVAVVGAAACALAMLLQIVP